MGNAQIWTPCRLVPPPFIFLLSVNWSVVWHKKIARDADAIHGPSKVWALKATHCHHSI